MTDTACTRSCAIESTGAVDAPVVVVLGGISASRHVTETADDPSRGWWSEVVGPDRIIDTQRYRVISMDYLDGALDDEALSTHDQAHALDLALDEQGIGSVHAVVGASYGGMVALAFAELYPHRVERLVVIGAAHESSAAATAQRSLQRKVVELGLRAGLESEALVIARGMALTTYSTATQLADRFDQSDAAERANEIERFLTLAGASFASRCAPRRFLSLSRSLDLHSVDPSRITAHTTLIGVLEDSLVPASHICNLSEAISGRCTLELVSSVYGHDAFLEEPGLIAPIIELALDAEI